MGRYPPPAVRKTRAFAELKPSGTRLPGPLEALQFRPGCVSVLTRMLPIPRTYRTIMLASTARGSTDPLYSLASAKSLTPPAP
jgi:hypothetical protein